jgi:hypothetical protein
VLGKKIKIAGLLLLSLKKNALGKKPIYLLELEETKDSNHYLISLKIPQKYHSQNF